MQWNRSNAIGLAKAACNYCNGQGTRLVRGREIACNCVYRSVFRACYHRFRECAAMGSHVSTVNFEFSAGVEGRRAYGRKREEYMADFCLVSRRFLDQTEYKIFRFHYLLGADWKLCCRRVRMERGEFFHTIYRIEERLGKAFSELQPYALYPTEDYFCKVIYKKPPAASTAREDLRRIA